MDQDLKLKGKEFNSILSKVLFNKTQIESVNSYISILFIEVINFL